jgi:hypothetical protein
MHQSNSERHNFYSSRLRAAGSLFASRPRRLCCATSNVIRLHIVPHCSRPLHALANSQPYSGYHSRHRDTHLLEWLDMLLRSPADRHHRAWTSVCVRTLVLPGQMVWNLPFADNRPLSRSQRTLGKLPPDAEGSHDATRSPTVDRRCFVLGIRTSYKRDMEALAAVLDFGDLLTPAADLVEAAHVMTAAPAYYPPLTRSGIARLLRQDATRLALSARLQRPVPDHLPLSKHCCSLFVNSP